VSEHTTVTSTCEENVFLFDVVFLRYLIDQRLDKQNIVLTCRPRALRTVRSTAVIACSFSIGKARLICLFFAIVHKADIPCNVCWIINTAEVAITTRLNRDEVVPFTQLAIFAAIRFPARPDVTLPVEVDEKWDFGTIWVVIGRNADAVLSGGIKATFDDTWD
jgi:hypothetical protein